MTDLHECHTIARQQTHAKSPPTNPRRPRQYTRLQTRTTRQHPNKPEEASSIMGAVHRQPRRSAPWRSDVNLHPTPPRHPSHHPIHAGNQSAGGVGQSGSKPMPAGVPGIRSPRKNVPLSSQCSPTIVRDSPSPQYRTPAAGLPLQATFCAATNQTARRPREREQRRPRRRSRAPGFYAAAGGVRGSGQTLGPIPRGAQAEHCRPPGNGGTWRVGASLGSLGRA